MTRKEITINKQIPLAQNMHFDIMVFQLPMTMHTGSFASLCS